jgi:hypothetical protein
MFPYPPERPASVASRKESRPTCRPATIARVKAVIVPRVVAIRNGGLLSSSNGVFDVIMNINAGSET